MSDAPLCTIERGTPAQVIERMLRVLYPDARTILDATYGSGRFWAGSDREVVGLDLDPGRARDICADFTRLPFADRTFDVVVFDPPYITHPSRAGTAQMARRFGAYPTFAHLHGAVRRGSLEAMRVARVGAIIKVQDQVRSARLIEMTQWVREVLGPPYQRVDAVRSAPKIKGGNWTEQFSAYANGATYLAYRLGSQYHRRRTA